MNFFKAQFNQVLNWKAQNISALEDFLAPLSDLISRCGKPVSPVFKPLVNLVKQIFSLPVVKPISIILINLVLLIVSVLVFVTRIIIFPPVLFRGLQSIFLVLAFITIVYFLIDAQPGDFITQFITNPNYTPEDIERIRAQLGYDKPALQRYFIYIGNFFTGDYGRSHFLNREVSDVIAERLPRTLLLFLSSTIIAFYLGFIVGKFISWRRGTFVEYGATISGIYMFTIFTPWLALLLIWLFAVQLDLFPTGKFIDTRLWLGVDLDSAIVFRSIIYWIIGGTVATFIAVFVAIKYFTKNPRNILIIGLSTLILSVGAAVLYYFSVARLEFVWDILNHMLLPIFTLTIIQFAGTMLLTRNSIIETMQEEYVFAARARGLKKKTVRNKFISRNAILPVMSSLILSIALVLDGGVITETIFSWQGLGLTLVNAVGAEDLPLAVGAFTFLGILALGGHIVVDILTVMLDPRIRGASHSDRKGHKTSIFARLVSTSPWVANKWHIFERKKIIKNINIRIITIILFTIWFMVWDILVSGIILLISFVLLLLLALANSIYSFVKHSLLQKAYYFLLWVNFKFLMSSLKTTWKVFKKEKIGVVGLSIIILFVIMAIIHPILIATVWTEVSTSADGFCVASTYDPIVGHDCSIMSHPAPPSAKHLLGTGPLGRDILSMILFSTTSELILGLLAAFITLFVATSVGSIAAYYKGVTDIALMRLADLVIMLPGVSLLIVFGALFELNFWTLAIIVGLLAGFGGATIIIKSQALTITVRSYIDAARTSGSSDFRIITKHIVPNVLPLAILFMMFTVTAAIFSEAVLSFLGVLELRMSWGIIIETVRANGYLLDFGKWWLVLPTSLAITLLCGSFYLLGRGLDPVVNPKLRVR